MTTMTDLIIIGSGPGGYRAAGYAARHGLSVTVFEAGQAGGTCLNEGCIPTKCLVHDSLVGRPLAEAMARKQQVTAALRGGVEALLSQPGVTLIRERATLAGPHTVKAGGETYEARNIIVATGSSAKMPPLPDIDRPEVMTSTDLLSIGSLPRRLAIVGAGVIGMEFASVFRRMGVEVEVYEFLKECLPTIDRDLAKRLRKKMEKDGIRFHLGYSVDTIASLQADAVLVATGRRPNTDGLGLEEIGVEVTRRGITVDDHMETTVPGVYAIGDVNGRAMLAHAATFQGFRAVNHILGREDHIRLDIMPAAVFTSPEVASVGMTDDACRAAGIPAKTHKGLYRACGKALADEATEGIAKIVTHADTGRVLGCHVLGAHAADMVQEVAALMCLDITLDRLADIIHIHPTLGEILQDAAIAGV